MSFTGHTLNNHWFILSFTLHVLEFTDHSNQLVSWSPTNSSCITFQWIRFYRALSQWTGTYAFLLQASFTESYKQYFQYRSTLSNIHSYSNRCTFSSVLCPIQLWIEPPTFQLVGDKLSPEPQGATPQPCNDAQYFFLIVFFFLILHPIILTSLHWNDNRGLVSPQVTLLVLP